MFFKLNSYYLGNIVFFIVICPKPSLAGGVLFLTFCLLFISVLYLFRKYFSHEKIRVDNCLVFLLLAQAIIICISNLYNNDIIRSGAVSEIIKLVIFLLTFLLYRNIPTLTYSVIRTHFYFALSLITIVTIDQLLKINLFEMIYTDERSISDLFRVVSTLVNPNFYGFMLIVLSFFLPYIFRWKGIVIGSIFIIFLLFSSGSRSSLVLFFIAFPLVVYICKEVKVFTFKGIVWVSLILSVISVFIYSFLMFGQDFKYLYQLTLLASGDLSSVSSFRARLDIWSNLSDVFSAYGEHKYFIGLGSLDIFRVTDNDFLSAYYKTGIVGAGVTYATYIYIYFVAYRSPKSIEQGVLIGTLILMLLLSFQSQTFTGYFHPIVVFGLYGALLMRNNNIYASLPHCANS